LQISNSEAFATIIRTHLTRLNVVEYQLYSLLDLDNLYKITRIAEQQATYLRLIYHPKNIARDPLFVLFFFYNKKRLHFEKSENYLQTGYFTRICALIS